LLINIRTYFLSIFSKKFKLDVIHENRQEDEVLIKCSRFAYDCISNWSSVAPLPLSLLKVQERKNLLQRIRYNKSKAEDPE